MKEALRGRPTAKQSGKAGAPGKAPRAERRGQLAGPIRHFTAKSMLFVIVCALPLIGTSLQLRNTLWWLLPLYCAASLLSFLFYWTDKRSAQRGERRTPEQTLHLIELLGGWPGALIAQQVLRHKTRKTSYQMVFWLIVAGHQLFWIDFLLLDGAYLVRQMSLPHH